MKNFKSYALTGAIFALIILGLFLLTRGSKSENSTSSSGTLQSSERTYDFGTVSMAKGKVAHAFDVRNAGSDPVVASKLYTSCMCTQASLSVGGKTDGPFGMIGHGFVPTFETLIQPGQAAKIEAVFDPAAHGPSGIGRIERTVTLETSSGSLQLNIKASVVP